MSATVDLIFVMFRSSDPAFQKCVIIVSSHYRINLRNILAQFEEVD